MQRFTIITIIYLSMDENKSAEAYFKTSGWAHTGLTAVLWLGALFLLVSAIGELKELRYVGAGVPATNTITVSGSGEVFAVPDRAEFSLTVREEAEAVSDAQETAAKKINDIKEYLEGVGVEEKDIKTTSYNVYPKYEWQEIVCITYPCPRGKQEQTGFEVTQTLSVKVKDTKLAGELLSGVGERGASDVSGLSFTIEDEDTLKTEARAKAIEEAREKAVVLAKDLNVKLVRVVGFYEDSGGAQPYYALGREGAAVRSMASPAVTPEIPTGENKIVSNVNITYEIK